MLHCRLACGTNMRFLAEWDSLAMIVALRLNRSGDLPVACSS